MKTDASVVVNLWKRRDDERSEVASILREIQELANNFERFQLSYVGKDANGGAHLCAKQATASRRRCLWINYIPSFLEQCLLNDCNPCN